MGGKPKALILHQGITFLDRITATARSAGVDGVAIVLGHYRAELEPVARQRCDRVALNPAPDRGMLSSARALALSLPPGASMLLWPVDHPTVRRETLAALLAVDASGRMVAPARSNRGGHPPLLPAAVVDALRNAPDDQRLDQLITNVSGPPLLVEVDDPAIHHDVDTPEDLASLF